jgi:hypothetical protein
LKGVGWSERWLCRAVILRTPHKRKNTVKPTLPLSGREEAFAIQADSLAACPLEGLVRSVLHVISLPIS